MKWVIGIWVVLLITACGSNEPDAKEWIYSELERYVADTSNIVGRLHHPDSTEHNWYFDENVTIAGKTCQQYQVDLLSLEGINTFEPLVTAGSNTNIRLILAEEVAFDTVARVVYRMDKVKGEYVRVE
jgi:hypothetical protein